MALSKCICKAGAEAGFCTNSLLRLLFPLLLCQPGECEHRHLPDSSASHTLICACNTPDRPPHEIPHRERVGRSIYKNTTGPWRSHICQDVNRAQKHTAFPEAGACPGNLRKANQSWHWGAGPLLSRRKEGGVGLYLVSLVQNCLGGSLVQKPEKKQNRHVHPFARVSPEVPRACWKSPGERDPCLVPTEHQSSGTLTTPHSRLPSDQALVPLLGPPLLLPRSKTMVP